jgi:hypothetical protein
LIASLYASCMKKRFSFSSWDGKIFGKGHGMGFLMVNRIIPNSLFDERTYLT